MGAVTIATKGSTDEAARSTVHFLFVINVILPYILLYKGVFEGLRKIVGVKNELSASAEQLSDRSDVLAEVAPLTSPIIMRTTIKRKVDIDLNLGLSSKKK